jgi:cytochrome P450
MAHDRNAGWDQLRAIGPVFQDELGLYHVTTYEGVKYIQQNPKLFSSERAFNDQGDVQQVPLAVDPPDHARYRRILDPVFAPRAINRIEDELRRQAADLIDAFADLGQCDAMADLAMLFPTQVFLTMFGLPLADRDKCTQWVRTINAERNLGTTIRTLALEEASKALADYSLEFIRAKQREPGDDLLSEIIAMEGEAAWTEDEMMGFVGSFINAGLDTVTSSLGFVFHYLATNPDVRQQIVEDPELVGPVIEEVIRMEPVGPRIPRVTTEDVEVSGYKIPADSMVFMCLGAANRDPVRFPHPDMVDLEQANKGHLTFGGGIHRCLGSHLARREMRIVIEEFHKRIPEYELAPGADPTIQWPAGVVTFESVPLVFSKPA